MRRYQSSLSKKDRITPPSKRLGLTNIQDSLVFNEEDLKMPTPRTPLSFSSMGIVTPMTPNSKALSYEESTPKKGRGDWLPPVPRQYIYKECEQPKELLFHQDNVPQSLCEYFDEDEFRNEYDKEKESEYRSLESKY
jgi:hypothetical protein